MRKKSNRGNTRKFRFRQLFQRRSRRSGEDGDWFHFEAEVAPAKISPRALSKRRLLRARVLALACLSVSVPLGIHWGYGEIFFKNEEFILNRLHIQTDGSLSETGLAEIANVAPGMNLMDLDLGRIQTQIGTLPQVEKVTVTRELPDRLNVIVRERMPVAWLSVPPQGIRPWDMERGFLLDAEGHLFRCLDLNEGMKSLPVVESFKTAEPVEGTKIESPGVLAGIKLILESDKRFLGRGLAVSEVRLRDDWALECDYDGGMKVTFGVFDFGRGLDDLGLILERAEESGQTLATVNVAASKNIPVTFAAVAAPAEIPATNPGAVSGGAVPADSSATAATHPVGEEQEKHLRSILKGG